MTIWQKLIKNILKDLDKKEWIHDLRMHLENPFSNEPIRILVEAFENAPDHVMIRGSKVGKRVRLELKGNEFKDIFWDSMFRASFEQNDFEGMYAWYEKCLNTLLNDYEELQKFRNECKDVKIRQKGISCFLFEIDEYELWFGRFAKERRIRRPWRVYILSSQAKNYYDSAEFKSSFGLINTFLKGIETLKNEVFLELPTSLRDLSFGRIS